MEPHCMEWRKQMKNKSEWPALKNLSTESKIKFYRVASEFRKFVSTENREVPGSAFLLWSDFSVTRSFRNLRSPAKKSEGLVSSTRHSKWFIIVETLLVGKTDNYVVPTAMRGSEFWLSKSSGFEPKVFHHLRNFGTSFFHVLLTTRFLPDSLSATHVCAD